MFGCAVILAKYGMDGKRDTRSVESNSLKDYDVKEGDTFDDPRLDKLWNKVCTCTVSCLWGVQTRVLCLSHTNLTHLSTGKKLWKVFQRGTVEPEEGIPASQGQDPRVQHPHRCSKQDGR